jgi:hypothetical protein
MFSPESPGVNPIEASGGSQARAAGTGARTESFLNSDETLPDLDSMAEAFMSGSSNEEPAANEYSASSLLKKPPSNKAPKWTEDFKAKEIAMGLRTALNKDKEG